MVRIRITTGALECALALCREFEPRHDLVIYFDMIGSASIVFGPFLGVGMGWGVGGAISLILLMKMQ